jgi:hypothetical protein
MAESVVPLHLDVVWNPNAPFAVLMSSDDGTRRAGHARA